MNESMLAFMHVATLIFMCGMAYSAGRIKRTGNEREEILGRAAALARLEGDEVTWEHIMLLMASEEEEETAASPPPQEQSNGRSNGLTRGEFSSLLANRQRVGG